MSSVMKTVELIKNISNKYASTLFAEGVVLIGNLLTLKLAFLVFGAQGFGEFAIARRAMNLIGFPMLIGLGISLPRFVAIAGTKRNDEAEGQI